MTNTSFALQHQFVQRVLSQAHAPISPPKPQGVGEAPVNIALSKYWGKRDAVLNLPMNGSVSISLPGLGTHTTLGLINPALNPTADLITLNQQKLSNDTPFAQRLSQFLSLFRPTPQDFFWVNTANSVPTAAGLASSASGYAALVLALDDLFGWQLPKTALSLLARLGSGSASRSLFNGFALWHQGEQDDGMDSFAQEITTPWPELCVGLLKIDISQKSISSTAGMQQTVNTCALYQAWPTQANQDMQRILQAIEEHDFTLLGQTAEHNALTMHATMMATWPPIVYWQPQSVAAMHTVWALRQQGVDVYFTMDAGPNLKLLFLETQTPAIKQAFADVSIIRPFNKS
ncbi:diphosphomevalonate decarboxylase [Thiomicrorhabdus aquaedulcis]|uniref:diphosphomevalonate decarboxylase n=1 Tax=Thiomicrorhabdus aquaedulcis TaxID=2211106 RepID=UPI000FDAE1DE|nr:diphosphomevalonate decarboxylase [Thiomicrorhabdus aquaedulcis]